MKPMLLAYVRVGDSKLRRMYGHEGIRIAGGAHPPSTQPLQYYIQHEVASNIRPGNVMRG